MLQAFRSTLSWLGMHLEPGDGCVDGTAEDAEPLLRLEQLVGELHLAALQTAVVTSAVNALAHGHRLENAASLKDLMPALPPPEKIRLSRRARETLGIRPGKLTPARDFFTAAHAAQQDLEVFCRDAAQFGTEEAAFLDVAHLDVAWHNLSTSALVAVMALEEDVRRCLPQRYTSNTPVLKKLLVEAARGGHPCVDAEGRIAQPDLPQRRAAIRPDVHLPCMLEHHGMTYQAMVKDISTGGAGLEGAPTLKPQTVVLIEFESGHCIAGLVVWSKGDRAGVKFDVPLKAGHPLLASPKVQQPPA